MARSFVHFLILLIACNAIACGAGAPPHGSGAAKPTTRRECGPTRYGLRVDLVGEVSDAASAASWSAGACARVVELTNCVAGIHHDGSRVRGSIQLEIERSDPGPKRVRVTGGTLAHTPIASCAVDAFELIEPMAAAPVHLTLHIDGSPPPFAQTSGGPPGRLDPEVIRTYIRAAFPRFRACYESGLKSNPALSGTVAAQFIIDEGGTVTDATLQPSSMTDARVRSCVLSAYRKIHFPRPDGGRVMVTYPIDFQN